MPKAKKQAAPPSDHMPVGQDLFLRRTELIDGELKVTISHHRVWDRERYIAAATVFQLSRGGTVRPVGRSAYVNGEEQ